MQPLLSDVLSNDQTLASMTDLQKYLRSGHSLGDAMDVSESQREKLYLLGYRSYEQARYSEAFKIFSLLVIYDHLNTRYLMALAGAAQMLGRHKDALQHYSTVAAALEDDPTPLVHSADCLIALGHTELAKETAVLAIELAEDKAPYAAARKRAESVLAMLTTAPEAPPPSDQATA